MNEFNFFTVDQSDIIREEMEQSGFTQLRTKESVDEHLQKKGISIILINSICGCAGTVARPAVTSFVRQKEKPDYFVTVFAGQDQEATEALRAYFPEEKPTSPSIALIKDGELCQIWHRESIEGREPFLVLNELEQAFLKIK